MSHHSDADSPRVQADVTEEEVSDRALLDEVLADDPEEDDLLQENSFEDDIPRPARRRRARRWVAVLVVLVVILSAGAVGAEYLVRGQVDSAVRSALPGLSPDARIATKGIVLSQVVGGSLDSLSVDSPSLTITSKGQSNASVTLSDVDVDLSHISLHKPYQTDTVAASGTVSWQQVATLAAASHPKLKGITLQAKRTGTSAQEPGVIQASMSVLGLSGQAEITPSLGADGSLILTITSTRMSGNTLGVDVGTGQDSMLSYVGLDSPQITIPANSLPPGLRPTSAIVTNDGLRLSLAGSRVNLGQL
ncbi:LmeA family phospholipid-binding protein [Actinomyces oris]|uniref:LmeA family phospholipid-binding protein n=1 Tax=Actinomyces oris TaxID=544580 RepID=UPI00352D38C0